MHLWTVALSLALLAFLATAQDIPGIPDGVSLGDLQEATADCADKKLASSATTCVNAIKATSDPCPNECKKFFSTYVSNCSKLFELLGLSDLAEACAASTEEDYDDYDDYAPGPKPEKDYDDYDDYDTSPPPPRRATPPGFEPSFAPGFAPSPLAAPIPAPGPETAIAPIPAASTNTSSTTSSALPASCNGWYSQISNQPESQLAACAKDLLAATTLASCPPSCTSITTPPPPECITDIKSQGASASLYDVSLENNPCFPLLAGIRTSASIRTTASAIIVAGLGAVSAMALLL